MSKLTTRQKQCVVATGIVAIAGIIEFNINYKPIDNHKIKNVITKDIKDTNTNTMIHSVMKQVNPFEQVRFGLLKKNIIKTNDKDVNNTMLNSDKTQKINVRRYLDIPLTYKEQDWVFNLCKRNNVDPYLIFGLIKEETEFQNFLPNKFLCMGLCQINPITANDTLEWLSKNDKLQHQQVSRNYSLLDRLTNIHVAICTIHKLKIKYNGSEFLALLNYGLGQSNVESYIQTYGWTYPRYMRLMYSYRDQLKQYGKIINELR